MNDACMYVYYPDKGTHVYREARAFAFPCCLDQLHFNSTEHILEPHHLFLVKQARSQVMILMHGKQGLYDQSILNATILVVWPAITNVLGHYLCNIAS